MELAIIEKKLAMDSRDIAKLTHKRHSDVLYDIRKMYEKLGERKSPLSYLNKQNKPQPYFLLNYEDTITLLTGYSVELRSAVVKRWIYLEKHYKNERKKSIETRNTFTDTLAEHGYTKQHEYIQTTQQMKKSLDITHKKHEMTTRELDEVAASEALAKVMINDEQGFQEVNPVCVDAADIVANAKKRRISA